MTEMQICGAGLIILFGLMKVVFGNDWQDSTNVVCIIIVMAGIMAMAFGGLLWK